MDYQFSSDAREQLNQIFFYLVMMFQPSPAKVESKYIGNEYIITITENGSLVNNYVFTPNKNGDVGKIHETGINLNLAYIRYLNEGKKFNFDVVSCEYQPEWGYIEFFIE